MLEHFDIYINVCFLSKFVSYELFMHSHMVYSWNHSKLFFNLNLMKMVMMIIRSTSCLFGWCVSPTTLYYKIIMLMLHSMYMFI